VLDIFVVRGESDVWPVQIRDKQQQPLTAVFDGTESLVCQCWSGEDQAVAFTLPVIWDTPLEGTIKIQVPGATSASQDVGLYQGLVKIADGSEALVRFTLDIRHAPGSGVQTITPYCALQDLLEYAPWVQLVQTEEDITGFLDKRIQAREWLDWVILNNYRGASVGLFETHSTLAFVFGGGVGWRRSLGPSPSLITYLAQNLLIVRPQIIRACAYKTISLIGLAQIGINNQYASFGSYYRDMSDRELIGTTAEVDLNGDGVGELFIPLSSTNTLMT
jgi:hypothetical protein